MSNITFKDLETTAGVEQKFITDFFGCVPNAYVFGGVGLEILTGNEIDFEDHPDLDTLLFEKDKPSIKVLENSGFDIKEVPHNPNLIKVKRDGFSAEVGILHTEDGKEPYILWKNNKNIFKIYFPEEAFGVTTITTLGNVKNMTPLGYMQIYNINRAIGVQTREKDAKSQEIVRGLFFPEKLSQDPIFMPKVERVNT